MTRDDSGPSGADAPNLLLERTPSEIREFLDSLASHPVSALVLDYDGTLAPFHTDRNSAIPWPGVREAIQTILKGGKTRVVLISGRPAEEVRDLLGVQPPPEIWGIHGRQRLFRDGHTTLEPLRNSEERTLAEAAGWLKARDYLQYAESKPGSIAVHWRGLSAEQTAVLRSTVHAAFAPLAERSGMSLLAFDGGLELRPLKPNKGSAVTTLLSELPAGTPFAFLGDDTTDEDAFLALRNTPALTILVRTEWRETQARVWIRPPEQLLAFLNEWATRCGGDA